MQDNNLKALLKLLFNRLEYIRIKNDLKIQDLARLIGVHTTTYFRFRKGDRTPSVDVIYNACKHFGVSSDYFLGLTDEERPLHEVLKIISREHDIPIDELLKSLSQSKNLP
jgi:transcriptional regulator with XRE-family HTH domain